MESNKDIKNIKQLNDEQLDNANGGLSLTDINIILDPCSYYNPQHNYIENLCKNCPHFTLLPERKDEYRDQYPGGGGGVAFCRKVDKYMKV